MVDYRFFSGVSRFFIKEDIMNIYLEAFGYLGTALVILSMTMTSVTKLRVINIAGSVISGIYSGFCQAWPVVVMNACLIGINLFHLIRESGHQYTFGHIKVRAEEASVRYFLKQYENDIKKYFPTYSLVAYDNTEIHLIWVESEVVGMLVGTRDADIFRIELDYAIPKYRDLSVGKYLFSCLKQEGVKMLIASVGEKEHNCYLRAIGFSENEGMMIKSL